MWSLRQYSGTVVKNDEVFEGKGTKKMCDLVTHFRLPGRPRTGRAGLFFWGYFHNLRHHRTFLP
jgi:hypothetical protein